MGAADAGSHGPGWLVWMSLIAVKGGGGSGYGVVGRGLKGRPEKVASPRRGLWKGIQGLRESWGSSYVEPAIDFVCGGWFFPFFARLRPLGGGEGESRVSGGVLSTTVLRRGFAVHGLKQKKMWKTGYRTTGG
jgi:hypothetical protein